uniref:Uncharacterized protein n=1 Tax=Glossina austeni TaxID=7395 RepID=A0A1A9UHX1_GLOAU
MHMFSHQVPHWLEFVMVLHLLCGHDSCCVCLCIEPKLLSKLSIVHLCKRPLRSAVEIVVIHVEIATNYNLILRDLCLRGVDSLKSNFPPNSGRFQLVIETIYDLMQNTAQKQNANVLQIERRVYLPRDLALIIATNVWSTEGRFQLPRQASSTWNLGGHDNFRKQDSLYVTIGRCGN